MVNGVWNGTYLVDAALLFVPFLFLYHIALAVCNNILYEILKGETGFAEYILQTNKLPTVSQSLPSSVSIALSVTCASALAKVVIRVNSAVPELSNIDAMVANELPAFCRTP